MAEPATRIVSAPRRRGHLPHSATCPPLVAAKLRSPQLPATFVARPHLHGRLDAAVGAPLTVVSAAAGYGKSTMVAGWAAGRAPAQPVAWVNLDAADNDPARLWTYLLASVRAAVAVPTTNPLATLPNPARVDADFLARVGAGVEALPRPVTVVVDNAHVLVPGPGLDSLAELLRHRLANLAVVLCSRATPPLPLARLQVAGELVQIGAGDLAFTAAEVAALGTACGHPMTSDRADQLAASSEGWVTGIRLAMTSNNPPGGLSCGLSGAEAPIADYLYTEVLASYPPDIQQFLLRTCVAEVITGALADELTGDDDGVRMLCWLQQHNAFVTAGPGPERTYRHHRMFRQFLRHHAMIEMPQELAALHRRAVRWYAGHGQSGHAARIVAEDRPWAPVAVAAEALACAGQLFGPQRQAICQVIAGLPPVEASPEATHSTAAETAAETAAACALGAAAGRDTDAAMRFAGMAREAMAREAVAREAVAREAVAREVTGVTDEDRKAPVMAALHLVAMMLARAGHQPAGLLDRAGTLLGLLDEPTSGRAPCGAPQLRAVGVSHRGMALMWLGRFEGAEADLRAAAAAAQAEGLQLSELDSLGHLALLLALRGRLGEAVTTGADALTVAADHGWLQAAAVRPAAVALALAHSWRGDLAEAQRHLGIAQATDADQADAASAAAVALCGVHIQLSGEDTGGARSYLAAARAGGRELPPVLRGWLAVADAEVEVVASNHRAALAVVEPLLRARRLDAATAGAHVVAARAHLALGAPAHARSLLAPLRRPDLDIGLGQRVEAWVWEARAADQIGHEGAVGIAVGEAVRAAAPEGYRRPFRQAGAAFAVLLQRHADLVAEHRPFVDTLRAGGPTQTPAPAEEGLVERVTDREGVILRYLPTLLTTQDIARELSVSPNTVKTHLKSLYRKLAVGNRRDAVRRARRLKLL